MSGYRSIFFEPDWVHVRYHGWDDSWPDPAIRLLSKRQGPLRRHLLLSELSDPRRVAAILDGLGLSGLAELVFHDFTDEPSIGATLRDRRFVPLGAGKRLLNIATFVFDLANSDDELLKRMSADTRRKIRKAEGAGLSVEAEDRPAPALITEFAAEFATTARERGFRAANAGRLERMFADGRATLFRVRESGQSPHYLMTYRAGDKAIFLHGVGRDRSNSGAGHLLQWGVIKGLRERGLRWYDMGGIPAIGDENGIFRFKRGFGGELVRLGNEYGRRSWPVRLARGLRSVIPRG
jgi:hypothetical protein